LLFCRHSFSKRGHAVRIYHFVNILF
jgi:hypothetical protein